MSGYDVAFNTQWRRWMYAKGCPKKWRPYFGDKAYGRKGEPFSRRYLDAAPKEETAAARRIAIVEAEPDRQRDAAVIAALEAMTPAELAYVKEHVWQSLRAIAATKPMLDAFDALALPSADLLAPSPYPVGSKPYAATATLEDRVRLHQTVAADFAAKVAEANQAQVIMLKAEPSEVAAFETGLLGVYIKSKGDKWRGKENDTHQNDLKRTCKLLCEVFGNIDYRTLDDKMAADFRDYLETLGKTYDWRSRKLQFAHRMYASAVNEREMDHNPFDDLTPRGEAADDDKMQKGAFTPAQLRAILDKAARIKFGKKRHGEAMHALRLVTYLGLAPNEALLIQRGDVVRDDESDVAYLDVTDRDCVTKQRHPKKSLKNRESRPRLLPLHPKLVEAGFLDFATKGDPQAFVFEAFPWSKHKYRRNWWDANFVSVLLADMEHVGITLQERDGKRVAVNKRGHVLAFYSMRHSMHDLIDNADISRKRQEILTGHASQEDHDKYSRGANLLKLQRDIAGLNPLADVVLPTAR